MLKSLDWYASLATAKGRQESGSYLIEGIRAISLIALNSPQSITELLVANDTEIPATAPAVATRQVTRQQFNRICSSKTPQGIAAVASIPPNTYTSGLPALSEATILALEDVQDPGNVGALIRTAAAFDVQGIILSESCADPFSPKVVQASTGTITSVWIRRHANFLEMIDACKLSGFRVAVAALNGKIALTAQKKTLLILGNEGNGVSPECRKKADITFCIPMNQTKAESLNVAISGAIALYMTR